MADFLTMTPEQKRQAIGQLQVLELRLLVLPENIDDVAAAMEAMGREQGVFIVSHQRPRLVEADIEEALENWFEVDQVVETLVD